MNDYDDDIIILYRGTITSLTVDGIPVTRDIVRQLDELGPDDWERFIPFGRVRTGTIHYYPGIELIGRDETTGALVRMFHTTPIRFRPREGDRQEGLAELPDLHDTLTREYERLPLIVLPREGRAASGPTGCFFQQHLIGGRRD